MCSRTEKPRAPDCALSDGKSFAGLSPDIEWGKGDGRIEIAANRQALPSSKPSLLL